MAYRYKVLLSAYSCRPGYGGESGIGWNIALQVAKFHDTTVLTRSGNRPWIERGLAFLPPAAAQPQFAYFDHSPLAMATQKWRLPGSSWWRYQSWQKRAHNEVDQIKRRSKFDLVHHVTWATFRSVPAVWGHGVPTVWGPVTGIARTPSDLLPWRWPRELLHELLRNASNFRTRARLYRAAGFCSAILVSTEETRSAFASAGIPTRVMPEAGIYEMPPPKRCEPRSTLKLMFSGRIVFYKGVHLALHALKASGVQAEFAVFGDGSLRHAMEHLARRLAIHDRVRFHGWVDRKVLLGLYQDFDVFLFPSLHDGIPQALLEAMGNGLPAVCLDCGGPAMIVNEQCGIRVRPGSFDKLVEGLARAIVRYNEDRALLAAHGANAYSRVMDNYTWDMLGRQLDSVYHQVLEGCVDNDVPSRSGRRPTGA